MEGFSTSYIDPDGKKSDNILVDYLPSYLPLMVNHLALPKVPQILLVSSGFLSVLICVSLTKAPAMFHGVFVLNFISIHSLPTTLVPV